MSSLLERLKKNTTVKEAAVLSESKFFTQKDMVKTRVPLINLALSGDLEGGIYPGLTMLAGQSKSFKTGFSLVMASAYMEKHEDAVLMFFDTEFGSPQSYFEANGIDTNRVLHVPITDIEQLKHEVMNQLQEIKRGDKLFIIIDSIGNVASKKEVDDALDGKSVADMSRAKQIKSLFRMVTPHLSLKDIPMVVINHTYKTMEMYAKDVVGGGTGSYYSSDNIWIISRSQDKDNDGEIGGYFFTIKVEKSRYVKEQSKLPVSVRYDSGISKYSGILDLALESGDVVKPNNGWYQLVDTETGEMIGNKVRAADTENEEFLGVVLNRQSFKDFVSNKYKLIIS